MPSRRQAAAYFVPRLSRATRRASAASSGGRRCGPAARRRGRRAPRGRRPGASGSRSRAPSRGPLTKTSTFWRPCSMPFFAHESAVTCAANGVDLREPLKPAGPALSHAITAPSLSVSVTIVLLKDVLMCAWPIAMFFLTRRRARHRVAYEEVPLRSVRADGRPPTRARRLPWVPHTPPSPSCRGRPVFFGPLRGACVGLRALAVHGEAAPVADAAIGADLLEPLDRSASARGEGRPPPGARRRCNCGSFVISPSVRSLHLLVGQSPSSAQTLRAVDGPIP